MCTAWAALWVAVVSAARPVLRYFGRTARTWCTPPPGFRPRSAAARRTSASSAALVGRIVGRGQTFLCTQNGRQRHSFHICKSQAWNPLGRLQSTVACVGCHWGTLFLWTSLSLGGGLTERQGLPLFSKGSVLGFTSDTIFL